MLSTTTATKQYTFLCSRLNPFKTCLIRTALERGVTQCMLVSMTFLFFVGKERGESNASVKSPKSPFYILVVSVAMLQTNLHSTYKMSRSSSFSLETGKM
jgi:flagellar basal body-associated protein FliL